MASWSAARAGTPQHARAQAAARPSRNSEKRRTRGARKVVCMMRPLRSAQSPERTTPGGSRDVSGLFPLEYLVSPGVPEQFGSLGLAGLTNPIPVLQSRTGHPLADAAFLDEILLQPADLPVQKVVGLMNQADRIARSAGESVEAARYAGRHVGLLGK